MASYIQATTNPETFAMPTFEGPDEFLFNVAKQKQQQFDAGLRAVGQQYNNSLNLPVYSDQAIAKRDAFMQEAKKKLSSIASADFSLQENVNIANTIYKPLVNDEFIKTDLAVSRVKDQAFSQAESDRTSKDEKIRNTYNPFAVYNMDREAKNFKSAKSLSDLKNLDFRYIKKPETSISDRILKTFNDAKLSDKGGVQIDEDLGQWILRQTNGSKSVSAFTALAAGMVTPEDRLYYESMAKYYHNSERDKVVGAGLMTGEQYDKAKALDVIEANKNRYTTYVEGQNQILETLNKSLEKDPNLLIYDTDTPEEFQQKMARINKINERKNEISRAINDVNLKLKKLDPNDPDFNQMVSNMSVNLIPYLADNELNNSGCFLLHSYTS